MEQLTIIGTTQATSLKSKRKFIVYILSNNTAGSILDLEKLFNTDRTAIRKRIKVYGLHSPFVTHYGKIPIDASTDGRCNVSKRPFVKWDRKKCKRDSRLCKNYHVCQNKRCVISLEKWIAPENTDLCYVEEPAPVRKVFSCPLASIYQVGV